MIIIQAYKGKFELTQSQKTALYNKAGFLKRNGYTHMLVECFVPVFADETLLQYVATDGEYTERAIIGKKGGLSNGLGRNAKKGEKFSKGNDLEMTLINIDKFEHVVTV